MHIPRNPEYLHHQKNLPSSLLREIVFGMEDGMVSTLGAITGIAIGTNDHFTVVLSGLVVVAVESVSMGVGSYLSNKSERAVDQRKLEEEEQEIKDYPEEEKQELIDMYVKDGWTKKTATQMAEEASKNPKLMLQEMAYRELKITPELEHAPSKNALYMGFSYILGGSIPVIPYLVSDIKTAITISIVITLIALFLLGVATSKFTNRNWFKSGVEMFLLASVAALIGFAVAKFANIAIY